MAEGLFSKSQLDLIDLQPAGITVKVALHYIQLTNTVPLKEPTLEQMTRLRYCGSKCTMLEVSPLLVLLLLVRFLVTLRVLRDPEWSNWITADKCVNI
jgi:hypothetical protein